jgi:hypothetical protein
MLLKFSCLFKALDLNFRTRRRSWHCKYCIRFCVCCTLCRRMLSLAYLIVFNIEDVASLHYPVDIDVLFCNQCYSGLSCRIFNTPAGVNHFCTNICLGAFAGSWFVDHGYQYNMLPRSLKRFSPNGFFRKGFHRKSLFTEKSQKSLLPKGFSPNRRSEGNAKANDLHDGNK